MADNYIENCQEKYEKRKQAYLKKKSHLPKSMNGTVSYIDKKAGEVAL